MNRWPSDPMDRRLLATLLPFVSIIYIQTPPACECKGVLRDRLFTTNTQIFRNSLLNATRRHRTL